MFHQHGGHRLGYTPVAGVRSPGNGIFSATTEIRNRHALTSSAYSRRALYGVGAAYTPPSIFHAPAPAPVRRRRSEAAVARRLHR